MLKNQWFIAEGRLVEIRGKHRLALCLVVLAAAFWPAAAASADQIPFDPNQIVFPIVGGNITFIDDFSQLRSGGRTHGATDMMANGVKGLPVVAAFDGVVKWIGSTCCYLSIDHGGGYETWYIHLNNDTPGTDDGLGWGIAPGIDVGVPVAKGQLIGYVGDSGNAEWVGPHLHFEIRQWGIPINPYPYLLNAPHLTTPGGPTYGPGTGNTFFDDDGSPHEADIEILFANGITVGCGNGRYCPNDYVSRGQMALFIYRQLALPPATVDYYDDDNGSIYEEADNAVTAIGIGFGCGNRRFCEDTPLLREEMAEFLVRTFAVPSSSVDWFTDDNRSPYQTSINAIKAASITVGCDINDAGRFCPTDRLTRGQMASFFVRAMGL